ncbi:MAG TPA: 3-hydroxyacyl-CoA dehydrogenase NAD-binding domain-containing protein [Candidatus Thermoplasmatota archaeon]|nr:3-hydroxyacyl-CoA dehydrogenase NAD-binding domain-containing protein [Candidatus Thermoplasmatota archaeon]
MPIRTVAVLGAGNMGSGIAQAFATAGLTVYMRDVKPEFVDKGRARIEGPLRKRVEQGKDTAANVDALLARIHGTTDLKTAVQDADLVVEAVFEDLKVKKEVFAEASKFAKPSCIFATNTSSLSVTDIAAATDRPDRFGGLHFFFPAAVNKLVEVVAGRETSPAVVAELVAVSRAIGKVPIPTADAFGFAVNRFFVPWVNESVRILEEGVADIATIDAAAKEAFGITMGPFELMNVTGVPISLHAERTLHAGFGEAYAPAKKLVHQVESEKKDWTLAGSPDAARFEAVKERLYGVTFGIAARLVEEGVATAVDTDKGATVGLRWAAGPFAMMNKLGTKRALAAVESYHKKWGASFPVAADLKRLGAKNEPWPLPAVRLEKEGHVAVLTVDRPDALNALNAKVLQDFASQARAAFADPDVRVVVVTGEGHKAFIAGADIKEMSTKTPAEARWFTKLGQDAISTLENGGKPVIVAVNGFAFGGGLELAMAGDIILASDKAVFGLPEVTLGIHPGFGGTQRLPRYVGLQRAKELVYTGRRFDALQAQAYGLVLEVVPAADLMKRAREIANAIAVNAPIALGLAKSAMNRAPDVDLATGLLYELEAVAQCFATEDQKGSMAAFANKTKWEMKGK